MEQRQFKDIVAFRWNQGAPLAFHARNLELAEISEDLWNQMAEEHPPGGIALESLNTWNLENNPDVVTRPQTRAIRKLVINVTQICNLRCTYCAAGGDGTYGAAQTKINVEKTLPQLKFFLDKLENGESFQINFLGGEPLLYPEGIREIGRYVQLAIAGRNIAPRFSIVTNGTLITEENLELLCELKAQVTVSLDGPPEINDRVRPGKNGQGSTAAVVQGIQQLVLAKDRLQSVALHGVFSADNLEIFEAYRFYKTLNVDRYDFTFAVGDNDTNSNFRFISQMNLIAKLAYQEGGEAELRKIGTFDQYFRSLDSQYRSENHCGAGKSFLMIDAKNNLFTCPWDVNDRKEMVGSGTELNEEKMAEYEGSLIDKNNCQTCWARYLCGGGCMYIHKQSSGNKNKKDGQFCYRTRSLVMTTLLYYKLSREIAD